MFILILGYCDFFNWSPATSTDYPEFINDMSVKLQNYFFEVLLLVIVTRKNDICAYNKQNYYCICRRPCLEPIIACDAKHCDIEWYHYACVHIKIVPKGSWFSENCTAKTNKKMTRKN